MPELTNPYDRKPKDYFYVNTTRCPVSKCARKTTHFLYFMVGPNLDIKCLYGGLCAEHAEQRAQEFIDKHGRETVIEPIEKINEKIREKYY